MGGPHVLHAAKHVRFPVLISVGANAEINFPRVFVGLECLGDTYKGCKCGEQSCEELSSLPKIGSGGPAGTADHVDRVRRAEGVRRASVSDNILD